MKWRWSLYSYFLNEKESLEKLKKQKQTYSVKEKINETPVWLCRDVYLEHFWE